MTRIWLSRCLVKSTKQTVLLISLKMEFHGKRALVTGASRGIGRAIVTQLAKSGAKVIAIGRSKPDLGQ